MIEFMKTYCLACEVMAPVIADLQRQYGSSLTVQQVNVVIDTELATDFSVVFLPTQVYLDGSGRELYRHVGFASKDDILANWRQLGYKLEPMAMAPLPVEPIDINGNGSVRPANLVFYAPVPAAATSR